MKIIDLSTFDNSDYKPGASFLKLTLWYFINHLFFSNPFFPITKFKIIILRLFGAKIGYGLVIKPSVNIKYPWLLNIGNHVWIGENVWIDNLVKVTIGDDVCISQGAMLLTGNHNYNQSDFPLFAKSITLENGVWIGAKSIVCPGVIAESHSILTVGSVATKVLKSYTIFSGNPAIAIRQRIII